VKKRKAKHDLTLEKNRGNKKKKESSRYSVPRKDRVRAQESALVPRNSNLKQGI